MVRARRDMAATLDAVLRARWEGGDDSVSNVALAERHLGVSEKAIRRWRSPEHSNDKPVPMAALHALPDSVAADLIVAIVVGRGRAFATEVFGRLSASLFGGRK